MTVPEVKEYVTTLVGNGPYVVEHNLDSRVVRVVVYTANLSDRQDVVVEPLGANAVQLTGQFSTLHGCRVVVVL